MFKSAPSDLEVVSKFLSAKYPSSTFEEVTPENVDELDQYLNTRTAQSLNEEKKSCHKEERRKRLLKDRRVQFKKEVDSFFKRSARLPLPPATTLRVKSKHLRPGTTEFSKGVQAARECSMCEVLASVLEVGSTLPKSKSDRSNFKEDFSQNPEDIDLFLPSGAIHSRNYFQAQWIALKCMTSSLLCTVLEYVVYIFVST